MAQHNGFVDLCEWQEANGRRQLLSQLSNAMMVPQNNVVADTTRCEDELG